MELLPAFWHNRSKIYPMDSYMRPPDDVYWHFKRLALSKQVGAEYTSWEDGCTYRVNAERRICRVTPRIKPMMRLALSEGVKELCPQS